MKTLASAPIRLVGWWQNLRKLKSLKPDDALKLLDCVGMAIGLVAICVIGMALAVMVLAF